MNKIRRWCLPSLIDKSETPHMTTTVHVTLQSIKLRANEMSPLFQHLADSVKMVGQGIVLGLNTPDFLRSPV